MRKINLLLYIMIFWNSFCLFICKIFPSTNNLGLFLFLVGLIIGTLMKKLQNYHLLTRDEKTILSKIIKDFI